MVLNLAACVQMLTSALRESLHATRPPRSASMFPAASSAAVNRVSGPTAPPPPPPGPKPSPSSWAASPRRRAGGVWTRTSVPGGPEDIGVQRELCVATRAGHTTAPVTATATPARKSPVIYYYYLLTPCLKCWRRGSVVRTSVFGWCTFSDLRLICD